VVESLCNICKALGSISSTDKKAAFCLGWKYLFCNLLQDCLSHLSKLKAEQVLPEGVGTSGRGEEVEKGHGGVNMVQILCTHACKWKNDIF
jgi:hypothetical protein